jgi:hypothetical protein
MDDIRKETKEFFSHILKCLPNFATGWGSSERGNVALKVEMPLKIIEPRVRSRSYLSNYEQTPPLFCCFLLERY